MPTDSENKAEPSRAVSRPSLFRRLVSGLLIAVLLLLVALLALVGGVYGYRDALIGWGARRVLQTPVMVTGAGFLRDGMRIDHIAIFDGTASRPTVSLHGLELTVNFRSPRDRWFPSLYLADITLHVDGTDPADTSYDFLRALMERPGSGRDPLPFLPKRIEVGRVGVEARLPDWTLDITEIGVQMDLMDLERFQLTLLGSAVLVAGHSAWTGPLSDAPQPGTVEITVQREGNAISVSPIDVNLPDIARLQAHFDLVLDGNTQQAAGEAAIVELPGVLAAGLLDLVSPEPIRFRTVRMQDVRVAATLQAHIPEMFQLQGDAFVEAMRIGREEAVYYDGDLQVTADVHQDGGSGSLTLGQGQVLSVEVADGFPDRPLTLTLEGWPREHVEAVLPRAYRSYLAQLPTLQRVEALRIDVSQRNARWQSALSGTVTMADGSHRLEATVIAADGDDRLPIDIEAALHLPQHAPVHMAGRFSSMEDMELVFTADTLSLVAMQSWLPPDLLPEGYAAAVSGPLTLLGTPNGVEVTADLQGSGLRLADSDRLADQAVMLDGSSRLVPDPIRLENLSATMRMGEWGRGSLTNGRMRTSPTAMDGNLEAYIDFYSMPPSVFSGVLGEVELAGPIRYQNGLLEMEAAAEGLGLSYGGWMPPAETVLELHAGIALDTVQEQAAIRDLLVQWNEGTELHAPPFEINLEDTTFTLPFTLTTDLTPLKDLMFISNVTGGTSSWDGVLHYTPASFHLSLEGRLAAEALAVLSDMVALGNATVAGQLRYGPEGLDGEGAAQAAEAAAFGATLHAVDAQWQGRGTMITAPSFEAMLFGGRVWGTAKVDLLGDDRGGALTAQLEDIDLGRFTEEYDPPEIRLTGLASGNLRVAWDAAGLQGFHIDLDAPDGCTVNKDLLEQLLLSQLTEGMDGERQLRILRTRVLGDAEDRPFDSMSLRLDWIDGRYMGELGLRSRALNITMDLRIDGEAVRELMRIRQESQLEDLASIQFQ